MPDTPKTKAQLLTEFADNSPLKAINAQDLRDFIVSVMQEHKDAELLIRGKASPTLPAVKIVQGAGGGGSKPALAIFQSTPPGGHLFEIWEDPFGDMDYNRQVWFDESGGLISLNWVVIAGDGGAGIPAEYQYMLGLRADVDDPTVVIMESLPVETHPNNHPILFLNYLGIEGARITKEFEYSCETLGRFGKCRSPDGSQWRISVTDAGAVTATRLSGGIPAWLQTLIVTDLGKLHTDVPFVYDHRTNATVVAGKLTQLSDARGIASYGAPLHATGGTVTYVSGVSGHFVNDVTASSMLHDAGGAVYGIGAGAGRIKCVVIVTDAPNIPATDTAGIAELKDAGNNRHIHLLDGRVGDIDGGNFANYFSDTTGTFRVIFWGTNDAATDLRVTAYGKATVTQANTHLGATTCTLSLGRSQIWGSSAFAKIRFCMGLTWDPSSGEMTTIFNALKAQWADITAHTP